MPNIFDAKTGMLLCIYHNRSGVYVHALADLFSCCKTNKLLLLPIPPPMSNLRPKKQDYPHGLSGLLSQRFQRHSPPYLISRTRAQHFGAVSKGIGLDIGHSLPGKGQTIGLDSQTFDPNVRFCQVLTDHNAAQGDYTRADRRGSRRQIARSPPTWAGWAMSKTALILILEMAAPVRSSPLWALAVRSSHSQLTRPYLCLNSTLFCECPEMSIL